MFDIMISWTGATENSTCTVETVDEVIDYIQSVYDVNYNCKGLSVKIADFSNMHNMRIIYNGPLDQKVINDLDINMRKPEEVKNNVEVNI